MAWISVGHSNEELCDKLVENGVIKSEQLLNAFKLTDRGDFVPEQFRAQAYFDRPFKQAYVHLSAPHMYATVLESLELREGHSFLNIGSGSGYLSCLAACLLGESGLSHGIDCSVEVVEHSKLCCAKWFAALLRRREDGEENIPAVTREGVSFVHGAGCPQNRKEFFYSLLADDGIMVASINEKNELIKIVRRHRKIFTEVHISQVLFAPLIEPPPDHVDPAEDEEDLPSQSTAWPTIGRSRAYSEISQSSAGGSVGTGITSDDGSLSLSSSPVSSTIFLSHAVATSTAVTSSAVSSYSIFSGSSQTRSAGGLSPATTSRSSVTPASSRSNSFHQSTPTPTRKGKRGTSLVQLPPVLWAPTGSRHCQFPPSFRKAVYTLLLASRVPYRPSGASLNPAAKAGGTSTSQSSHCAATLAQNGACVCGRVPLHIWTYIISFASRDWFVPTLSELQLLQSELAVEKQLREASDKRLRAETASRLSAERERDMYRIIIEEIFFTPSRPSVKIRVTARDDEDEEGGGDEQEASEDEQEEMELLGHEHAADDNDELGDSASDADDEEGGHGSDNPEPDHDHAGEDEDEDEEGHQGGRGTAADGDPPVEMTSTSSMDVSTDPPIQSPATHVHRTLFSRAPAPAPAARAPTTIAPLIPFPMMSLRTSGAIEGGRHFAADVLCNGVNLGGRVATSSPGSILLPSSMSLLAAEEPVLAAGGIGIGGIEITTTKPLGVENDDENAAEESFHFVQGSEEDTRI